jgi:hypothetical protein
MVLQKDPRESSVLGLVHLGTQIRRNFHPQKGDDKCPCLTRTEPTLAVHAVGMEPSLNGSPNDTVQCLDYVEMTLVFLELDAVPPNYLNFRVWHSVVYISVCTLGPLTQQ